MSFVKINDFVKDSDCSETILLYNFLYKTLSHEHKCLCFLQITASREKSILYIEVPETILILKPLFERRPNQISAVAPYPITSVDTILSFQFYKSTNSCKTLSHLYTETISSHKSLVL